MDKHKLEPVQPRFLRYRGHYKIYVLGFMVLSFLLISFWGMRIFEVGFSYVWKNQVSELFFSALYFSVIGSFYFFWLRSRLKRSVQVFKTHLLVHNGKSSTTLLYSDIESLSIVCWSVFYVKMRDGYKYYFNSGLERVDYIWEGIYSARNDLILEKDYEEHRVKLVQYDHHQKRKEWFFKHKMIDLVNWVALPLMFIMSGYFVQTQTIEIHQHGLYFFRLFMFALLILLSTAFFYSLILKKFIFDRKVEEQLEGSEGKTRNLEFEGIVLQRSKIFQLVTSCFLLALIVKLDVNLFSVSKVKEELASLSLKRGHAILVDNRFNCIHCLHALKDGDVVLFGRGYIGQILAKEGEMVGQISSDTKGRTIASENVHEVPHGHFAIKANDGQDIVFIKVEDLIGKIQK